VYLGRDTELDRQVAVKILATQFAADPSFVQRFRREAQMAAKLNHPKVVGVNDTGSEEETHYIVMEYVEGRTLEEFLSTGRRLSPIKSVELVESVCRALTYAHRQGIVHRDIKPGNIMVTREGEVKVMDFGIARLTTSAETIAQTAAVLGTAAYLSPEQAQGKVVDARTDIYSTGCVLYECLTGRPPFTGDSPVAVAYKHVQETPELPSLANSEVTASLDAVTMRAMAKNPDNRYQTAEEFRADLERLRTGQEVSATPIMPAAATTQVIGRQPSEPTSVLPLLEEEERKKGWVPALIVLAILAILGGLGYLVWNSLQNSATEQVRVPSVIGFTEAAAESALQNTGLDVGKVTREVSEEAPGSVIRQDPAAQDLVEEGTRVDLVVARGPREVEVPSVEGLSESEAVDLLEGEELGFNVTTQDETNDLVEAGDAIRTEPEAGSSVEKGSDVTLFVSSGSPTPAVVTVPDVVCQSIGGAKNQIQDAGLEPVQSDEERPPNPDCPNGNKVVEQDPAAGSQATEGDSVTFFLPSSASPSP
jgi:beta-lactam-binding protein with PASTA domain/tRNA A-37 threonylcarbamoyl transferase component Bud32